MGTDWFRVNSRILSTGLDYMTSGKLLQPKLLFCDSVAQFMSRTGFVLRCFNQSNWETG